MDANRFYIVLGINRGTFPWLSDKAFTQEKNAARHAQKLALSDTNATGRNYDYYLATVSIDDGEPSISTVGPAEQQDLKPPSGIKPKALWIEDRIHELIDAMKRQLEYENCNMQLVKEWNEELADLLSEYRQLFNKDNQKKELTDKERESKDSYG